mgnify:CR=1 FL=1
MFNQMLNEHEIRLASIERRLSIQEAKTTTQAAEPHPDLVALIECTGWEAAPERIAVLAYAYDVLYNNGLLSSEPFMESIHEALQDQADGVRAHIVHFGNADSKITTMFVTTNQHKYRLYR